jgi:hypothetical protein
VVTGEFLDGVELVALLSDLVAVPPELRTDVLEEPPVPLLDGRVELFELRDGVATGRA